MTTSDHSQDSELARGEERASDADLPQEADAPREGLAQGRGGQVGVAVDRLKFAGDRFQDGGAGRGRHLIG